MITRPSMKKDLDHITGIDGGNLIYSMWEGYKNKPFTKKFIKYLETRGFTIHDIHTSGHADIDTLKKMVEAIRPKNIVPIHTFHGADYSKIFGDNVMVVGDGEVV